MPRSPAPEKQSIKFSVPPQLLQDAQEMAERDGWNESEFHRAAWVAGLNFYAEQSKERWGIREGVPEEDPVQVAED